MIPLKERFIVDENSQRVGVLLDIEDYRQLLEDLGACPRISVIGSLHSGLAGRFACPDGAWPLT